MKTELEPRQTCCVIDGKLWYRPPFKERVKVWYHNWRNRHVAKAVKVLSKALKDDPGFRQAWHANIAMPIYDATRPKCYCAIMSCAKDENGHLPDCCTTNPMLYACREMPIEQCNFIADKLMRHLFQVYEQRELS